MTIQPLHPAYLADREIAYLLGRKVAWFRKHRDDLVREGFPPKDKIIGLTCRADVEAWIAKRRVLSDRVETHHDTTDIQPKENLNAL
jgi:hypothetical protein